MKTDLPFFLCESFILSYIPSKRIIFLDPLGGLVHTELYNETNAGDLP